MNQKKECMDVHVNGLKFHVQTFGSGVPVIMIMGLGAPGDKWKHNYELLSRWFWCIVPDNRGAGLSDKPEVESYTTEQMADDIIGIMDALDIKKAHVIGVSMGGAIAQQVALKAPKRVISLILTSTFASVSPAFKKALNLICDLKEDTDPAVLKQLNLWMTYGRRYITLRRLRNLLKKMQRTLIQCLYMPIRRSVGHVSATIRQTGCMSLKCRY